MNHSQEHNALLNAKIYFKPEKKITDIVIKQEFKWIETEVKISDLDIKDAPIALYETS